MGGKPKRISGEERRGLLVSAAAKIFAEKNFHTATMGDIAAEANVSEALLFSHFGTKKKLYGEVLRASNRGLDKVWAGVISTNHLDVYSLLTELTRLTFRYIDGNMEYIGLWLKLPADLEDPEVRAVFEDLLFTKYEYLKNLIARGVAEGSLRPEMDPEASAWLLVNSLQVFLFAHEFKRDEIFNEESLIKMSKTILGEKRYDSP